MHLTLSRSNSHRLSNHNKLIFYRHVTTIYPPQQSINKSSLIMDNVIVIGAGVVGMSIAYGLIKKGVNITLVDEGNQGFKASTGNFGLVWCQGKGFENQSYSRITFESCLAWQSFADTLEQDSGLSVDYENKGGLYFLFDEDSHNQRIKRLESIYNDSSQKIEYDMLSRDTLRNEYPAIGDDVFSASYCKYDGTCDPLKLVYALRTAIMNLGGTIISDAKVTSIKSDQQKTTVVFNDQKLTSSKVVIAAGLGNTELSQYVGMNTPLKAIKGQIVVSQRMPSVLTIPSLQVRQTSEGTVICGDSHEDVGLKTNTTVEVLRSITKRAIKILPTLASKNVNRAWGALRVMTPDTVPIYEQSQQNMNVFNVSCHSGVTLAAFHANELAEHIKNGVFPDSLASFKGDRF